MSETKRLHFTGYSDDTFSCNGPGIDVDYDTCANGKPVVMLVDAGGDRMLVVGQYAPGPCAGWLIGVAPEDDDVPLPGWPITIQQSPEVAYSPVLIVDAPAGVVVQVISPA